MMALGRYPEYHWNQIISNLSTGLAEKSFKAVFYF